jgi:hypothetical protein
MRYERPIKNESSTAPGRRRDRLMSPPPIPLLIRCFGDRVVIARARPDSRESC